MKMRKELKIIYIYKNAFKIKNEFNLIIFKNR